MKVHLESGSQNKSGGGGDDDDGGGGGGSSSSSILMDSLSALVCGQCFWQFCLYTFVELLT